MKFGLLLFGLCCLCGAPALAGKPAVITFVDGKQTKCEVLFKHPNCDRLIVRSLNRTTVQSFATKTIHSLRVNGKTRTYNAERKLTAAEAEARKLNGLWGDHVGPGQIGNYASESWAQKPLLVWARPGESGNATEASNWLDETGKPLTAKPFQPHQPTTDHKGRKIRRRRKKSKATPPGIFDGDILLPAAGSMYKAIQPGKRDYLGPQQLRHLTVEANAGYNVRYTVRGNLWIKHEGHIGSGTQTGGLGSAEANKHTFFRICGKRWPAKRGPGKDGTSEHVAISHWVGVDTGTASLEVIGRTGGPGDRITVSRGTLIISENSHFGNGPRAGFYTMPGTTLILLDGASVGCLDKVMRDKRGTYGIAGTLMFGTPEHPLTRDLRFEGALYEVEELDPNAKPGQRLRGASFVLGETGKMVVHSKDPETARVIFCPRPKDSHFSSYAIGKRAGGREMPKGITAVFRGETQFNGVVFDGFYKGGIAVSPEARRKWKNVSFGKENHGKPQELFTR